MTCVDRFQRELLHHGIWDNLAAAAIGVPLFAATAQNLTESRLLKCYKDLDYAGSFLQRLKRFANAPAGNTPRAARLALPSRVRSYGFSIAKPNNESYMSCPCPAVRRTKFPFASGTATPLAVLSPS